MSTSTMTKYSLIAKHMSKIAYDLLFRQSVVHLDFVAWMR